MAGTNGSGNGTYSNSYIQKKEKREIVSEAEPKEKVINQLWEPGNRLPFFIVFDAWSVGHPFKLQVQKCVTLAKQAGDTSP